MCSVNRDPSAIVRQVLPPGSGVPSISTVTVRCRGGPLGLAVDRSGRSPDVAFRKPVTREAAFRSPPGRSRPIARSNCGCRGMSVGFIYRLYPDAQAFDLGYIRL
jgi:hypothetical protein